MGLKRWFNELMSDARAVWGAPGANRPLTRRWLIDKEISNRNKQILKKDNDPKKTDQTEQKKDSDNINR
jgi:hypothetical protein